MKIEQAKNTLSETSELLQLQINQSMNELNESYRQIVLAEKTVEQSKENLKISNDNYHAGIIGVSDLLEAQAAFQSSSDNLTEARCNYQIKLSKYQQAIGIYK